MTPAPARAAADRVVVEQRLGAPYAAAWAALTEPGLVSRWLTACTRLSARNYALRFAEPDGDHTKTARVIGLRHRTAVARYSVLLADPGYPDSVITVTLRATGPHTSTVVLHHQDPPEQLVEGYRTGWRDYLQELARLVEPASRADPQPIEEQ